jgi:hypothetical protein
MKRQDWHQPAGFNEVAARASGRRRWNKRRQELAARRRAALARFLEWFPNGSLPPGAVGLIARALRISRSQLRRDRLTLEKERACPECGQRYGEPVAVFGGRGPWCLYCGARLPRADARAGRLHLLPRDWSPFEFDVAAYQELERLMCEGIDRRLRDQGLD